MDSKILGDYNDSIRFREDGYNFESMEDSRKFAREIFIEEAKKIPNSFLEESNWNTETSSDTGKILEMKKKKKKRRKYTTSDLETSSQSNFYDGNHYMENYGCQNYENGFEFIDSQYPISEELNQLRNEVDSENIILDSELFIKSFGQGNLEKDLMTKDMYYPGLIDDAINKNIDFYRLAFDVSFGKEGPPKKCPENQKIPMSLIEAFDYRVSSEIEEIQKKFNSMAFYKPGDKILNIDAILQPEEFLLANTTHFDLIAGLREKPQNELSAAVFDLQRAEYMNAYYKSLIAAKNSYIDVPSENAKKASLLETNSFHVENITTQATEAHDGSYRPIEIVSYLGIIRPNV